jgi:hypothetical protein
MGGPWTQREGYELLHQAPFDFFKQDGTCVKLCNQINSRAKHATNWAFERGPGGGSRLPRRFLVLFHVEREQILLSQASCLQLAEAATCSNHWNTISSVSFADSFPKGEAWNVAERQYGTPDKRSTTLLME